MNTLDEANRLLALADKATQGPWIYGKRDDEIYPGSIGTIDNNRSAVAMQPRYAYNWETTDAEFIASAHDMAACIRALLAEREQIAAETVEAFKKAIRALKSKP
jgi:hypothetical protein